MMKRKTLLPILLAAILLIAALPLGIAAAVSEPATAPRAASAVLGESQTVTTAPMAFAPLVFPAAWST